MKKLFTVLLGLAVVATISSCKKDDPDNPDEGTYGYFTYHNLTVQSNPSNYSVEEEEIIPESYSAELKDVNGTEVLEIFFGSVYSNATVTVDFTGVANYSSDNTNLSVSTFFYNGGNNVYSSTDPFIPGTGAYMEILTYADGVITGNLRYMVGRYDTSAGQNKYGGIDDCLFEIKLEE